MIPERIIFVSRGITVFHVQPEDDHCQAPKHVVVPYVVNTLYIYVSSNKVVLDRYIHCTLVSSLQPLRENTIRFSGVRTRTPKFLVRDA